MFREAQIDDVDKILYFINELAKYEKMENDVVATKELLEKWIFIEKKAKVIFLIVDNKEVGFALYFYNFSTFLGKPGIHLEDLYVSSEYRGFGYGKLLLKKIASIAYEEGCGRLEWTCLNWNKPSIDFYLSLNAVKMDEWSIYRMDQKTIKEFIGE